MIVSRIAQSLLCMITCTAVTAPLVFGQGKLQAPSQDQSQVPTQGWLTESSKGIVYSDWMDPEFEVVPYESEKGNQAVWTINASSITKEIVESGSVLVYCRSKTTGKEDWISPLPMHKVLFTSIQYMVGVGGGIYEPLDPVSTRMRIVGNITYWEYSIAVGSIRIATNYHSSDYHQYRYVVLPSEASARQGLSVTARRLSIENEIQVAADVLWVDTGVMLKEGESFSIEADGTWSNSGPPAIGPDGFIDYVHPGTLLATANLGSLIGKVGDVVFGVGSNFVGASRSAGRLYLAMNDTPGNYSDNQGKLRVRISKSQ